MNSFYDGKVVEIDYTNWRGQRRVRRIVPRSIRWGSTEWHPDEQWLLLATCLQSGRQLEFACCDIHSWKTADDQTLPWRS
jgi:hypothetical protein